MPSPTKPTEFPVRRALATDADEFVRLKTLIFRAWPFPVDLDIEPEWPRRCAQVYRDLLAGPGFASFVVDDPNRPGALLGCVTVAVDQRLPIPGSTGRVAYVADMCTVPEFRGQGLGRALLRAATRWAGHQGAGRVHLYATEQGRRLYSSEGFESGGPFLVMECGLGGADL
ncbi:Ribosomal protein S18 acetylase RimI [Austwickia chelonae]|uniref:Putative acetyltransferase n=1 Tax=Austwickia chelonae NBRC 105200 TaxID=1184607 RepID=K6VME4_9MICO|nr:GNAT family N-acetyltransferase [Austwickia chelonae]GAB76520.1 putative acetyltransferase [Austwickia chelonae NBRC 105200]SEW26111.1 Ribosomal protein S18 acetylase RimI [Austwickia chelonae]